MICKQFCTLICVIVYVTNTDLIWFGIILPARDIHIVKELEDVDTMERQPVNFLCEVNQVNIDGRWYRDDCRIRPGDNIKTRHQGM